MAFEAFLSGTRRRVSWPSWWVAGVASMLLHAAAAVALAAGLAPRPAAGLRLTVVAPSSVPTGSGGVILPVRIAGSAYTAASEGQATPAPHAGRARRRPRHPQTALALAPPPVEPPPIEPPPLQVPEHASPVSMAAAAPAVAEAQPASEPLPASSARGLRLYETYPSLPPGLPRGGRSYLVSVEICVAATGSVEEVHVQQGAAAALDEVLVSAIKTWRYRPYTVGGSSRAFCHSMRIVYKTG
jgi:TonB family protein